MNNNVLSLVSVVLNHCPCESSHPCCGNSLILSYFVHSPISWNVCRLPSLFNYCESLCILKVHPKLEQSVLFWKLESLKDKGSPRHPTDEFFSKPINMKLLQPFHWIITVTVKKITDILFSLAKRHGWCKLNVNFCFEFCQKNGQLWYLGSHSTKSRLWPYNYIFISSLVHACVGKNYSPSTTKILLQSLQYFFRGLKWEFRPEETTCILSSIFALIFAKRMTMQVKY